jgi:hypothetical protein
MLGNLAIHKSTSVVALGIEVWERIVSLLRYCAISCATYIANKDSLVPDFALYALAKIVNLREGVEVVRETKIWEYLPEFLGSRDPKIRGLVCNMVGSIAGHDFVSFPSLGSRSYQQIVSLLW